MITRYGKGLESEEREVVLFDCEKGNNIKEFCLSRDSAKASCFDPIGDFEYNMETKEITPIEIAFPYEDI